MASKPIPTITVVSNRSFVLGTTLGHSIRFVKNEPISIPRNILEQAMASGVTPVEELQIEEPTLPRAPEQHNDRMADIRRAVEGLIERNSRGDFTAAGLPRVVRILGYDVHAREVAEVMQNIYDEQALGDQE
jgi:hypothetical protein